MENVFEQIWGAIVNLFDGDMTDKDLAAKLDEMAKGKPGNWRASVVDLMNLLGIDSSAKNREKLAAELGVVGTPGEAAHNEALRKALMLRIADAGGNVPSNLMD